MMSAALKSRTVYLFYYPSRKEHPDERQMFDNMRYEYFDDIWQELHTHAQGVLATVSKYKLDHGTGNTPRFRELVTYSY